MQVVILAGGLGTRIAEESHLKPKPMIEIGGKPILWHIMKLYGHYGFNDFVICLGYKGQVIKQYFHDYYLNSADVTINLQDNSLKFHQDYSEPWKVTLVDTGENTLTGGRLKRVSPYLDEQFCFTYGDGVSNVNLNALVEQHRSTGCTVTLTAVQPAGRYGAIKVKNDKLTSFQEKPIGDGGWVNGGFFVCEKSAIDYISGDNVAWEAAPIKSLIEAGAVGVHKHHGFWASMDTMRDKENLENIWKTGNAPWKVWM